VFGHIRSDFRRCGSNAYGRVKGVLLDPAMWAVFTYRLLSWVQSACPRPMRWFLAIVTIPTQIGIQLLTHVQLSLGARIGPGLYLPHLGFVVVGAGAVIGSNCTIAHGVTIGHARGRNRSATGTAVVGNRVYIGPGAMVLGEITIGDDALIGAGAVVMQSVPPRGVMFGNPARLISLAGSFDLIDYPGMENDAERMAALNAAKQADILQGA
jgi:serine O-acetyltransferase